VLDPATQSVDDQQARAIARLDRRLSDQLRRQLVIELGRFQRGLAEQAAGDVQ